MPTKFYNYDPSGTAAVPFAALFALSSVAHLWQMARSRTWYLTPFLIGAIFEATGYLCRYISSTETPDWTMKPYVGQSLLILLGPALFAASIYMILGRIILFLKAGPLSPIRPSWLTKVFVIGDVLSFLLQSGGGGMMASATEATKAEMASSMILGGLFVQILFFGLFVVVSVIFHRRMLATPMHHLVGTEVPWSRYMKILYAVSLLILVRSVYRIIEYMQGKGGYLQSAEVFVYALDGALMLACCLIFNVWHPSMIVSGQSARKQAEDLEM